MSSADDDSAYFHSTATLNYIRSLLSSGYANIQKPLDWSFSHVRSPELQKAFSAVIENLQDSLDFMKIATGGVGGQERGGIETVDMYTRFVLPLHLLLRLMVSHEALLLEYEEALTRGFTEPQRSSLSGPSRQTTPPLSRSGSLARENGSSQSPVRPSRPISTPSGLEGWRGVEVASRDTTRFYNVSSHFIWIGDRTRQLDGAHVEYFRGIANPIGIKVGPSMEAQELVRILDIVNPERVPGKVTVIGRYGASKVEQFLPGHIDAVKATDHVVVWQCDAMHGNTKTSQADPSLKTRFFADIIQEITKSMEIHRQKGTILGGVHLELTGEVNEEGYSVVGLTCG